MRFAQTVFEIGRLELEFDGPFEGGKTGELGLGQAEDFVNAGPAFHGGHVFAVHLDLDIGLGEILDQGAQAPGWQGG